MPPAFVDVSGTRWIKIYYIDATGYATLSPLSAGRWNSAMGPPQQLTYVSNGQHTIYSSELYFTDTTFDGVTTLTCGGGGYMSGVTTVYLNRTVTDYYVNGARFSVMVHEYGHALGLLHNDQHGSCSVVQIMYSTIDKYFNCGIETPQSDDVAGVNSIY